MAAADLGDAIAEGLRALANRDRRRLLRLCQIDRDSKRENDGH